MLEIAVAFPEDGHFLTLVAHFFCGELLGDIVDVTAFMVISIPFS